MKGSKEGEGKGRIWEGRRGKERKGEKRREEKRRGRGRERNGMRHASCVCVSECKGGEGVRRERMGRDGKRWEGMGRKACSPA